LSPDQRFVGFVAFQIPFEMWDFRTGEKVKTLEHGAKKSASYAWSPVSKTLVTVADATLQIRGWPSGKSRRGIDLGPKQDPREDAGDVRLSADGKRIEVLTSRQIARRFDMETGAELDNGPAEAHSDRVRGAVIAADGKLLTLGDDNTIRVWDPETGRQVKCHNVDTPDYPWQLPLSADGRLMATNDRYNISVYERDSGKLLGKLPNAPPSHLFSMDFDSPAPVLRVRTYNQKGKGGALTHWSQLEWIFARNEVSKPSELLVGNVVALTQDGRLAASFDINERIIRVAATDTKRVLRSFPDKDQSFQQLAFCPDGRGLIVNGNHRFTLWELTSLKERWRVEFPQTGTPDVLANSSDVRWLARADRDNQIHLYDGRSGERVHSFVGHDGPITSITFAPDHKTLVSACEDSTVLVWDLKGVIDRMPVPKVPDAESLEQAWKEMAGPDAALAYRALGRLVDGGDATVSFFSKRLRAARPVDGERVQKLLTDLSSETFIVRERTTSELK